MPRTAGCWRIEGNSVVPRGILAYDGESWHTLATVCGGPGDTMRIAWAGPEEFWTVSEPSRPRQGSGTALCRFKDGAVVASYSTADNAADPYRQMNAAACNGPDDCWFGGIGCARPHRHPRRRVPPALGRLESADGLQRAERPWRHRPRGVRRRVPGDGRGRRAARLAGRGRSETAGGQAVPAAPDHQRGVRERPVHSGDRGRRRKRAARASTRRRAPPRGSWAGAPRQART